MRTALVVALLLSLLNIASLARAEEKPAVVSFVKITSECVPDVSSLEAWRKSFLRDVADDQAKAIAIFNSVVSFVHHEMYAREYLHAPENCNHDVIKAFNVYGHSHCCCTAAYVSALARSIGMEARGWSTPGHSLPEVKYAGEWHMIDPAFINYFPKADGKLASVDELIASTEEWYGKNPGYQGNNDKLVAFMRNEGWKKGPDVYTRCTFFNSNGWLPEQGHGWNSMMRQFGNRKQCFVYENNYTLGYQVNNQLRKGQKLVFNWSNKGLFIGKDENIPVESVTAAPGKGSMSYAPTFGDLTQGRVGNGRFEWTVPLDASLQTGALAFENLVVKDGKLSPANADQPGTLILRLPCSYIYLAGELRAKVALAGGEISASFSDNHGLDWKELGKGAAGEWKIDLSDKIHRRYDYRLKLTLKGAGTALESLFLGHDIQHSQRALPTLAKGENKLKFSAGPAEGTITVEGSTFPENLGTKQLSYKDFHPVLTGLNDPGLNPAAGSGEIIFPITTPGDIQRVRTSLCYRARAEKDGYEVSVSYDGGKTFKAIDRAGGPFAGMTKNFVATEVPKGTRTAHVKFSGRQVNVAMLFAYRIDVDYAEPHGGFRPISATYEWSENGAAKKHAHVAKGADEAFSITCGQQPLMKSLTLQWAE